MNPVASSPSLLPFRFWLVGAPLLALAGCQSIEDAGHLVTGSVSGLRPSAPVADAPRQLPPAAASESADSAKPILPLTSLQRTGGGQTGAEAPPDARAPAAATDRPRQPPSAPPAQSHPPVAVQPLSPPVALAPDDAGPTSAEATPDDRAQIASPETTSQPPPSSVTQADVTAAPQTAARTAAAPPIEGHVIPASILDGDTFRLGDRRIRLQGIDAPELDQICQVDGEPVACGQDSRTALIGLTVGALVHCERIDVDAAGRDVSRCSADGVDIAAAMVRSGHAVADRAASADYAADEASARDKKYGVWRGTFQMPWDWRADRGQNTQ